MVSTDRDGRQLLAGCGVDRDAATVVVDLDAAVGEQRDHDPVAVAGQRLVDGVVDDLPDQVVQAALAGRPDVHAGTLADRLETLEDLDRGRVVLDTVGRLRATRLRGRTRGLTAAGSLVAHAHLFVWAGGPRRGVPVAGSHMEQVAAPELATSDAHDSRLRASFHVMAHRRGVVCGEKRALYGA